MPKYWIMTALLALAFALPAAAESENEDNPADRRYTIQQDGWLFGDEADEALLKAKKYDAPIALAVIRRIEVNCKACAKRFKLAASAPAHKKMVRVVYYTGEGSKDLNSPGVTQLYQIASKTISHDKYGPDTYYLNADGMLLGYADHKVLLSAYGNKYVSSRALNAMKIHDWSSKAIKTIASADELAQRGQFAKALSQIEKISKEDEQAGQIIGLMTRSIKEEQENVTTTKSYPLFTGLDEQKLKEYDALASAELDDIKTLIENNEQNKAKRALAKLIRLPENFTVTEEAKQLYEQMRNAQSKK
ncbi:MAG: hypothetical protein AAGB26_11970 [Planctomycetota bacterium]